MPSRIAYASRQTRCMVVARFSAARREQSCRLLDVAPGGGEAGRESGEDVAVRQVSQCQRRLPGGARCRDRDRRWLRWPWMRSVRWYRVRLDKESWRVGQHGEAPGRGFESWSKAVLPGVSHPSITGPTAPVLNCKNSLERAHYVTR